MKRSTVNKTTAKQIIRLLDYCFKMGVVEACYLEDDYAVKDWLEEHKPLWTYGSLSEPETPYDWQRWRYTLFRWTRLISLRHLGETYIDLIRKSMGFHYALLPLSMRFYLMGVEEWIDYPNRQKIELFVNTLYVHWKPMKPATLQNMRVDDYISYIQEFIYELGKLPEEDRDKVCKVSLANSFVQALWQFTRRYTTHAEIRKGFEATTDI